MAFSLVVDDFLIKYHKQEDADHLLAALREKYVITTDMAKTMKYVVKHNKVKHIITLSMPDYITKALKRFGKEHVKGADSPLIYVPPYYGAKTQLAAIEDESAPLSAKEIKEVQEIVGVFLSYCLGSSMWQIRYERNAHGTCWNKGGHSREAKQTRFVGCTWR